MMNKKLKEKILKKTREMRLVPTGRNKHLTFVTKRNSILSVGWNDTKTHPKAAEYGYRFDAIHSELSAILRFRGRIFDLKGCTLINTRINSLGNIGYSKP